PRAPPGGARLLAFRARAADDARGDRHLPRPEARDGEPLLLEVRRGRRARGAPAQRAHPRRAGPAADRRARGLTAPSRATPVAHEASPAAPALAQSSLRISGMHCIACADVVERALRRAPGVVDAQVSAATQCAT